MWGDLPEGVSYAILFMNLLVPYINNLTRQVPLEVARNMANKKNSNYENVVKPIVVLVVICLITSALLAVTNYFTAPIIAEQEQQAAYAAYFEVLPGADSFTTVEGFATTGVEEAVKADNRHRLRLQGRRQGLRRRRARDRGRGHGRCHHRRVLHAELRDQRFRCPSVGRQ